jgi:hypothetical protein
MVTTEHTRSADMTKTHQERMSETGCAGHLMEAGLGQAFEIACRPSFGGRTVFRFHMTTGEVLESEPMLAIEALRRTEVFSIIERYERYWPETDTWELRWTREGGLR